MLDNMHENNMTRLSATDILPDDLDNGSLVGRLWVQSPHSGPRPVVLRADSGFTHKVGDVVQISSTKLCALINTVTICDRAPPWEYGVRALTSSLAARWLV